ncbi:MAG: hypothetical protein ACREXP_26735, partial [Steroidobacteraceae bacterium]
MKWFGPKDAGMEPESTRPEGARRPTASDERAPTIDSQLDREPGRPQVEEKGIEGERGIPSVNRARSLQSRLTGVLAIALI